MSGPSRVPDTDFAGQRPGLEQLLGVDQLIHRPAHIDLAVSAQRGHAGRVVAAILKPFQPANQYRDSVPRSDERQPAPAWCAGRQVTAVLVFNSYSIFHGGHEKNESDP